MKCAICGNRRGKRVCRIRDDRPVCSICCAENRDGECEGCRYYSRGKGSGGSARKRPLPPPHMDPDVDRTVEDILALLEDGKVKCAELLLRPLIRDHPGCHAVNFAAGTMHLCRKEFESAIDFFRKSIDAYPDFIEAHFNIAGCYKHILDLGNMLDSYRRVMELGDPDDELVGTAEFTISWLENHIRDTTGLSLDEYFRAQGIFDTAVSHMERREWQDAVPLFLKCLEINGEHVQSYGNLGLCLAILGKREEALKALEKALEIDPEYEPAMLNKAGIESLEEGEDFITAPVLISDYYRTGMPAEL